MQKHSQYQNKSVQSTLCELFAREDLSGDWLSALHVDFPSIDRSTQLNDLLQNSGVCGFLEGKNYHTVDMVFQNIGAYIDRATGFKTMQV